MRTTPAIGLLAALLMAAPSTAQAQAAPITSQQAVAHAFNRLTFSPRPGDVVEVTTQGWWKWAEQQSGIYSA